MSPVSYQQPIPNYREYSNTLLLAEVFSEIQLSQVAVELYQDAIYRAKEKG